MALSIKAREADELARELVALTHESLTDAITIALRERVERVRAAGAEPAIATRLQRLANEYRSHPVVDPRPAEEILGYDDVGLPR